MSISPLAAAKRICERSGWTISNLKLQKILYMAHMAYMGEHNGQPLIDGQFEAWDYGPVEPSVYRYAAPHGRDPICNAFYGVEEIDADSPEAVALDQYTDALLHFSAPQLVDMTHWDRGAWARNYAHGARGVSIPDTDILDEYRSRTRHG